MIDYGMDVWIDVLSTYRMAWISGRVGVGKTSIAYKTAEYYLKKGYKLITNNKCVWADENIKMNENGTLRAVVLIDEGGLYLKVNRQVELMASYPAKMDVVYLIPSYWPPARAAQQVRLHGMFTLRKAGLPWNVYKWTAGTGAFRDSGIVICDTRSVFGIYDRQDPSAGADEIIKNMMEYIEEFLKYHGRENIESDEYDTPEYYLQDAASAIAEAGDEISSSVVRLRKKRKY